MTDQHASLSHQATPTPSFSLLPVPDTPFSEELVSQTSLADDPHPYVQRTDAAFHQQFQEIADGTLETVVAQLTSATDPRLKHPFAIRGYHERGIGSEIPVDPAHYRNTQFLLATEPLDEDGVIYKRVEFGYSI